jgi:hypothetical protein
MANITLAACGGKAPYTWSFEDTEVCGGQGCCTTANTVTWFPSNVGQRVIAKTNPDETCWESCSVTHQTFFGLCTDANGTVVTFNLYEGV